MDDLESRVRRAVQHFWQVRRKQAREQGQKTGKRDYGNRAAVTAGKQIDGFIYLMRDVLVESELPPDSIRFRKREVVLPE